DLAPILLIEPKLYRKAQITPRGMLRISGFFPTESSQRINFDLMFQAVQGRWRLFGISANEGQPQQAPAAQAAPQTTPAKAPEAAAPASSPLKAPVTPKADDTGSTIPKNPSRTEVDIRDQ